MLESADLISAKHAGSGELKSSSIGGNIRRRQSVLADIKNGQFGIYALVVNKSRIWRDSGLRFKRVVYKFLHGMFYSRLQQVSDDVHVLADQYGSSEFMLEFQGYIGRKFELFSSFDFKRSQDEPILQVADVVAGSIRRVYEGDDAFSTLECLGYPSLLIEPWPPEQNDALAGHGDGDERERDDIIQAVALERAGSFVERNMDSTDESVVLQVRTLRFLLHMFYENPTKYHSRAEIVEAITHGAQSISPELLSRNVLARLRSEGIVLVSTDSGIKIPSGYSDVRSWLDRIQSQVAPYLGRMETTRNALLLASANEIDILTPEHKELRMYVLGKERMQAGV